MTPPAERPRALSFRLLAITPSANEAAISAAVSAARAGGARIAILLREPRLPQPQLLAAARALVRECRGTGATILIHGSPAIAIEAGADGVHLPDREHDIPLLRDSLPPGMLIGVSRHSAAAVQAERAASYVTVSPVFAVPGKAPPLGVAGLARACAGARVPTVALGGITAVNAAGCIAAGASAVAVMRAVWDGNAADNVLRLLGALPPQPGE